MEVIRIKSLKLPAKAGIYYGISAVIGRGMGLLLTPLFTRILSGEEYGIYSHFQNWLSVLTIPATFELYGTGLMRAIQKSKEKKDELISSAFLVISLLCSLFCILYFTFYPIINKITRLGVILPIFIFVEIITNSIINLYLAVSKFHYNYRAVFSVNLISTLPSFLLSLILIYTFGPYGIIRVIAQLTVSIGIAVVLLFIMFKNRFKPSMASSKKLIKNALPYLPHFLLLSLTGRLDRLVIGSRDTSLLSKYTVAATLGSLIIFTLGALFSALIPWMLRKISAKRSDLLCRLNGSILFVLAYLSLMLLSLAPELLSVLAPPEYTEAIFVSFPVAVSVIPSFLFTVNMTGLTHGEGKLSSTLPSLVGASIMALGSLWFINYSYLALSLVYLTSYIFMWAISSLLYKRLGNVRLYPTFPALFSILLLSFCSLSLYLARGDLALRLIIFILCLPPLLIDGIRILKAIKE